MGIGRKGPSRRKSGYRVVAPDRYLRALPAEGPVTVTRDGRTVARTEDAIELVEGDRPGVYYLPRADVAAELLPSGRVFACRWKGEASHFHVRVGDARIENGAWEYADPPPDAAALAGRVAFDADAFEIDVGTGSG